jgi:hypothetical protein
MAVDQFGNPLTEEELYQLMLQQQQMGLLPGLLGGPAVDTFSGIPSSLPAYGPAAGLGPSAYMGAPQGMPTYNQSPSLAAPSMLVDNTQAGMATVPFTGMESSFGDGVQVAQAGPSWGFNVSPDSVGVSWGVPKDLPTQDPTGGIVWPDKGPVDLPVSDIVKDIIPLPGIPEGMSQPEIDVETQIDTFSELGGIPAVDVDVQAGMLDVGPTSVAQLGGADYSQVLSDAGMAPVVMTSQAQQSSSGRESDLGSDEFGGIDPGIIERIFDTTKDTDKDFKEYWNEQKVIEDLLGLGIINADDAAKLKGYHLSDFNEYLTTYVPAVAYELFDEVRDTGATGWRELIDALSKGYDIGKLNVKGGKIRREGGKVGTIADPLIDAILDGTIDPSELEALAELDKGTVNSADIAEIVSQVDTFADLADVDVQTQVDTFKDFDKIAADTAARQAQIDADKAANAAARASKQQANRRANQRKAMLAKQKLAAKNKLAAQKAAAAQARAAVQAQAAAQAQAQSEANAAIARVAKANALMGSKAYQESGLDGLTAAQRDIVAAAQVDTFAGISGMGMGFMGSNIGQEDGGGYTGGDFSSGAGWE